MGNDPLLTESEAARELRVSEADIKFACRQRLISHVRIRQFYRLFTSEVDSWRGENMAALLQAARVVPEIAGMRRTRDPRFVYFIDAGIAIKIGVATNPSSRLASLQTGNHVALNMIGFIPGGEALERAIQWRLCRYCVQGEWFRAAKPVRHFIELALRAANG